MSDAASGRGEIIEALVVGASPMALDQGRPDPTVWRRLEELDESRLLAPGPVRDPELAKALLAALWLLHDGLDQSHRISQGLTSAEGSYWHGMMHRREGDFSNAKYWFRRTGAHPIHPALTEAARDLATSTDDLRSAFLRSQTSWDAAAFVDLCQAACSDEDHLAPLCRAIQMREWELLFDHCQRRAAGPSDGAAERPPPGPG